MGYTWDIEIPAGTAEATPVEVPLDLHKGVITKIGVYFPDGCCGVVKVRILRGKLERLLPSNPDEWITGNDQEVEFPMSYALDDVPYSLDFVGISPDAYRKHTVTVRITLLPEEVAIPFNVVRDLVQILKRLLGVA